MAVNALYFDNYNVLNDDSDDEIVELLCILAVNECNRLSLSKEPCRTSSLSGHAYVIELLRGHGSRCYDLFRMEKEIFIILCKDLKEKELLKDSRFVSVEEQVAIFLLVVSHNERNRMIAERFQHSGETISRHFKKALKAICRLGKLVIVPPSFDGSPPEIRHNPKYYPFFQNCVGAIDGTHIDARVPLGQQIPYRGKKVDPTQNVMCACSFDMRFTYVMSGWEGTANDSRVFLECVTNPDNGFPMPPSGKYYLVNSGYTNMPGFLSPYRGERYHLRDYRRRDRNPTGPEEIFNYRHSSLRNVIERCFGVLKARFPILKQMPPYSLRSQRYIVVACCAIHNFIRMNSTRDPMFDEYGRDDLDVQVTERHMEGSTSQNTVEVDVTPSQLRHMARVRDNLARDIWTANQS